MIEVMRPGTPVEVDGLDADWVLDLARDAELMARQAERAKLRAANRWADLHAATAESGVEVWGNAGALECEVPIGGAGAPTLAAFSVEPLGAALGISTISAMNLISAAVELRHRLPGLWALSEGLAVPAWKPRLVARLTGGLSAEAAAYVDAELAPVLATRGGPTIERVVREAVARFQPEDAAEAERAGKAAWDVRIIHPGPGEWAGTSWLDATADTVELTKFGDLVADIARRLGEAGDPDTLEQRRAKAIGIVADVHAGADLHDLITALVTPTGDPEPVRRPRVRARDLQLYLHLSAQDLDGGIGTVETLGAVTLERIEAWLARHTAAGARVRVTPVLDLARVDAVDRHDPPAWMAAQVRLRDQRCVFPYCQTHARDCDLDHVVPYDDTGPPGQTNPLNLAPVCRRHHRAKTAKRWRYHRTEDGSYAWTSPHDDRYLVKDGGTLALTGH
jgi:hypothetical protein